MKIAFVNFGFYIPSKVLTPLYEYSQILSKKGLDVTVFVRDHKENIKSRNNLTVRAVCRNYIFKITRLIFLIKLIFILNKEKFDVIHIFNSRGFFLLPLLCKGRNTKWIDDIQTGSIYSGIRRIVENKMIVYDAHYYDNIIVLSNGLKCKLFGNKFPKNTSIVPLGVNLKRCLAIKRDKRIWRKYGVDENETIIIYVGKLDKTRNPENMLKAFKMVLERSENKLIKLVIVGGEEDEIECLKKISLELTINNSAIFLGKMDYESIPTYLVNSDIGIAYIPKSDAYDVQPPLKIFEYLGASLPTIATNTLGNLEIIKNGINGIITSDNYEDFALGILRILNNPKLYADIKNHAFDSVIDYDWENIVDNKILKIYMKND